MNMTISIKKLILLFNNIYGKRFYNKTYVLVVLIFLISGFEILGAFFLTPIFNVMSSHEIKDIFMYEYISLYVDDYRAALIYSLGLFLLVNILKNISTIIYSNTSTILRLNFTKLLRNRIFLNILINFYKLDKAVTHNIGELNNIIILESYNINTSIGSLLALLNAIFVSIILIVYLLYLDFINTLIISVSIFAILYMNKFFFNKVGLYSQQVSQQRGVLSGMINEVIRNIKLVYTKNAFDYEIDRFNINNSLDKEISQKRDFFTNYTGPLTEILSMLIMVFTIYIIANSNDNIGENIAYIYVIFRLMPYIKMINTYKVLLVSNIGAIDNILSYTSNDNSKNKTLQKHVNEIESIDVKNLSFSYNSKCNVFENFNFKLNKGSILELIGKSGSGKSTLFDILLKLRDEYQGKVLVNGIELKEISSTSWYSRIGYVPQEALLFDNSLAYNVAYPNVIDEKKVIACLKQASLTQYIDDIYYQVGEHGNKLSGGQKQRVSIARALYGNPSVIFFDEATSALDKNTEDNIVEAINYLPKHLIILLITHRELKIKYTHKINLNKQGSGE